MSQYLHISFFANNDSIITQQTHLPSQCLLQNKIVRLYSCNQFLVMQALTHTHTTNTYIRTRAHTHAQKPKVLQFIKVTQEKLKEVHLQFVINFAWILLMPVKFRLKGL